MADSAARAELIWEGSGPVFSFETTVSPDVAAKLQQLSLKLRLLLRVTTELALLDAFSLNNLLLRLLNTACASPSPPAQSLGRLDSAVEQNCQEDEYPTLTAAQSGISSRFDSTLVADAEGNKTQTEVRAPSWTGDSALALSRLQALGNFAKKASFLLQPKHARLIPFHTAVKHYQKHGAPTETDKCPAAGHQSAESSNAQQLESTGTEFLAHQLVSALNVQDISHEEAMEAIADLDTREMLPDDTRSEVSGIRTTPCRFKSRSRRYSLLQKRLARVVYSFQQVAVLVRSYPRCRLVGSLRTVGS